jgi:hypothetical protein
MRHVANVVLAISIAIVINACGETRPFVYRSSATLDRAVTETTTLMKVNSCGSKHPKEVNFSAISAVDSIGNSKRTRYLLVAPLTSAEAPQFVLSSYALQRGAVLHLDDAISLVSHLRAVRSSWTANVKSGVGRYNEFLVIPSGRQVQTSDSVVVLYPSLEVHSSRVDGKRALQLAIRERSFQYTYIIDDEDELDCCIEMFERAIRNVDEL